MNIFKERQSKEKISIEKSKLQYIMPKKSLHLPLTSSESSVDAEPAEAAQQYYKK